MAKLCIKAFGVSCGIVAAAITLIVGTLKIIFFLESGLNKTMALLYLDYQPTLISVILNSLWGFVFAYCVGAAIAWLYNRIVQESCQEIQERIKAVARTIWESKGRPEGTQADDWREAEKRVRGY